MSGVITRRRGKPLLVIDLLHVVDIETAVQIISKWMMDKRIEVLNVVGPRESRCPGIYNNAKVIMEKLVVSFNSS